MNISFPSLLNASLPSFHLQERITLTTQQMAIAKIALVILAALAAGYFMFWWATASHRVTVIEADGSKHPSPLDKVNGNVKVVFDSFLGSGATVEGEFTDGQLNGHGKEIFPYGSVKEMEGEYKNGRLEGQGKITYRNGKIEEGTFKNGQLVVSDSSLGSEATEEEEFIDGQLPDSYETKASKKYLKHILNQ